MADTAAPKKKREMLTSFSIIFILLAIVAVITIFLNGATYTIDGEEGAVVAATLSDFLMSPVRGFADAIDVCLFVMVLGGFLGIVNKTNAIADGIAVLVKKMGGNELKLIPILMAIFALGGTTYGMCEETVGFYALLSATMMAAGFDSLTGAMMVLLGAGVGCLGSTVNPFAVGAAGAALDGVGIKGDQTIFIGLGLALQTSRLGLGFGPQADGLRILFGGIAVGLGLALLLLERGLRLLLNAILVGLGLLLHLRGKLLLAHLHLALAQFCLTLGLGNLGVYYGRLNDLLLLLLLNGVGSVGTGALGVLAGLKAGTLDGKGVLLLGNVGVGLYALVIGLALGLGLGNGDFLLGLGLGNCGVLLDLGGIVHAKVGNEAVLVHNVLDVAGENLNAELLHVTTGLLEHLVRERVAVGVDRAQVKRANDLAHVALQRVLQRVGNLLLGHIEEVALCKQHALGVVGHMHLGDRINLAVDEVIGGNVLVGLDVNRDLLEAETVNTLKERNLKASAANKHARALVQTTNDEGHVGRGLHIAGGYKRNDDHQGNGYKKRHAERNIKQHDLLLKKQLEPNALGMNAALGHRAHAKVKNKQPSIAITRLVLCVQRSLLLPGSVHGRLESAGKFCQ